MPFTDKQIQAALRAWWDLDADEPFIWDLRANSMAESFKATSFRDMRAALEAAAAKR